MIMMIISLNDNSTKSGKLKNQREKEEWEKEKGMRRYRRKSGERRGSGEAGEKPEENWTKTAA